MLQTSYEIIKASCKGYKKQKKKEKNKVCNKFLAYKFAKQCRSLGTTSSWGSLGLETLQLAIWNFRLAAGDPRCESLLEWLMELLPPRVWVSEWRRRRSVEQLWLALDMGFDRTRLVPRVRIYQTNKLWEIPIPVPVTVPSRLHSSSRGAEWVPRTRPL